jgi:glycosyltransferase involved in cell wall biosynthesis
MPEQGHVHFVQSLEPLQGGGLGAAALQLHQAMRQAAMPSQLFSTRAEAFASSWPGVSQFTRRGPARLFYAPEMVSVARRVVTKATIIHGHGLYVCPNQIFGREARRLGRPLVYHVHGFFEPWILQRSRWKKRLAHWLFEDANFRHVRLWRALTDREADQIKTVVGAQAQVVVAPNGMDLTPVRPAQFGQMSGRRRALFLGRLHPKKGLDLLIQAWAGAGSAAADWELVIAGPDEGGHEAEVRQWVAAAGLGGSVIFCGSISGQAKYDLIASADLFILTSYSEGLPMAPLEAMAAGVPVALTQECNLPEILQVEAGWLCPAEPTAVGMMLKEALLADDAERRQRGAAGRRLVEEKFSWQKTVATLRAACQQIV